MQEVDRTRRVAEVIRRELAQLIAREISDPRIRNVSINGVRISRDLKNATIFVSSLGRSPGKTGDSAATQSEPKSDDSDTKAVRPEPTVEELLNNASGFLRRLLSRNTDLRVTPSLRFRYDDSIQRGVEMSSLIDSLVRKDNSNKEEDDDGA